MPPHSRMSLTQQLLLRPHRAFWQTPYKAPPSWFAGVPNCMTASCRISSRRISSDVMEEMQAAGLPMMARWFAPHLGSATRNTAISRSRAWKSEVRAALEAMACDGRGKARSAGQSAMSTPSLERVQVKVTGMARIISPDLQRPDRSAATDGRRRQVRCRRALQPGDRLRHCINHRGGQSAPSTWSIPGWTEAWGLPVSCHPGGLSYDTFPVNLHR